MSFRGGGGGGGRWDVGAAWEPGRGGTCTGREVYVREGSEGRSSSKCITSLMQVQVPVPVQVGQLQEILYCMYSSIYFSHQQQHNAHFYYQSLLYPSTTPSSTANVRPSIKPPCKRFSQVAS